MHHNHSTLCRNTFASTAASINFPPTIQNLRFNRLLTPKMHHNHRTTSKPLLIPMYPPGVSFRIRTSLLLLVSCPTLFQIITLLLFSPTGNVARSGANECWFLLMFRYFSPTGNFVRSVAPEN